MGGSRGRFESGRPSGHMNLTHDYHTPALGSLGRSKIKHSANCCGLLWELQVLLARCVARAQVHGLSLRSISTRP